jgi:hypothetical protein
MENRFRYFNVFFMYEINKENTHICILKYLPNTDLFQGRIYEGKEPPQFIALFRPMLVLKV